MPSVESEPRHVTPHEARVRLKLFMSIADEALWEVLLESGLTHADASKVMETYHRRRTLMILAKFKKEAVNPELYVPGNFVEK